MNYCPFCQSKLSPDVCAKCGAYLHPEGSFCAGCGVEVLRLADYPVDRTPTPELPTKCEEAPPTGTQSTGDYCSSVKFTAVQFRWVEKRAKERNCGLMQVVGDIISDWMQNRNADEPAPCMMLTGQTKNAKKDVAYRVQPPYGDEFSKLRNKSGIVRALVLGKMKEGWE